MASKENSEYLSWKEDIINNQLGGKREWTDQERMQLCHKMDKEFDEQFKSIPKCDQKDKWTEENWKDKMAEHPLFAAFLQEDSNNLIAPENALSDGIAQLKYDSEHASAEEIVENYREEGNIYYKAKKYKLAIISYTEALKQELTDNSFLSRLHNNRAACHFSLGNYRSSLNDCEKAVSFNPGYAKPIERAVKCCLKLSLYTDCFSWCDKGMKIPSIEKDIFNLKKLARKEKTEEDARKRRNMNEEKETDTKIQSLLEAFKEKKIPVNNLYECDKEELNGRFSNARVKLNSSGDLEWDVICNYPEYSENDLIENFNEHTKFITQLDLMFEQPPPWDLEHKYESDKLNIFFVNKFTGKPIPVDKNSTLSSILIDERFPIDGLFPTFLVVPTEYDWSKFGKIAV